MRIAVTIRPRTWATTLAVLARPHAPVGCWRPVAEYPQGYALADGRVRETPHMSKV
jgi:hypothetical protein